MRAGRVGSFCAVEPSGAGCTERHSTVFEALRTSMKVPGCNSCSRSLVRPAKPLQLGGDAPAFVAVADDPTVVVGVVGPGGTGANPPGPLGDGNVPSPVLGPPRRA